MSAVDVVLARRVEEAAAWCAAELARAHARLHPTIGAAERVAGGCAAFLGSGSPFSQAWGLGMSGPVAEADLQRLETFYRSRGASVQVLLCPLAHHSLLDLLGRRGYCLTEFENVLVRPVSADESLPPRSGDLSAIPAGFAEAALWARTVAEGFSEQSLVPAPLLEAVELSWHLDGSTAFLARVGDDPAGGATLLIHKRLAVLSGASTRPPFHRRGVHAALVRARLAHAAAAGCDLAVTTTRPGTTSQRNVERLGFRVAYARSLLVRDWATPVP